MESPSPRRKRKAQDEEELRLESRRQEKEARKRQAEVVRAKPVKASPKPQKVIHDVPAKTPSSTSPILSQINNRINDFLDLMASTRKPANLEDLAYAALEKRLGNQLPPEGDFSKFCSPRAIKEAMKLAELLDEAAALNNPHMMEKWGVV